MKSENGCKHFVIDTSVYDFLVENVHIAAGFVSAFHSLNRRVKKNT